MDHLALNLPPPCTPTDAFSEITLHRIETDATHAFSDIFSKPEARDPRELNRFEGSPHYKYLLYAAAIRGALSFDAQITEKFPFQAQFAKAIEKISPRVLVVNSTCGGVGDELVESGIFIQAFLDSRFNFKVTVKSDRDWLYDHDRIEEVIPHAAQVKRKEWDVIVNLSSVFSSKQHVSAVDIQPVTFFEGAPMLLCIGESKSHVSIPKPLSMYSHYLYRCAELGLPYRWGEHNGLANSFLINPSKKEFHDAALLWQAYGFNDQTKVVAINPFGWQLESKGTSNTPEGHQKLKQQLELIADHDFQILFVANGRPWGTRDIASQIIKTVNSKCREQIHMMPDLTTNPRLPKYLFNRCQAGITAEGGGHNLFQSLGKKWAILGNERTPDVQAWIPTNASSMQRVVGSMLELNIYLDQLAESL